MQAFTYPKIHRQFFENRRTLPLVMVLQRLEIILQHLEIKFFCLTRMLL